MLYFSVFLVFTGTDQILAYKDYKAIRKAGSMVSSWDWLIQFHAEPLLPPHDAPGRRAHREVRHRSGQDFSSGSVSGPIRKFLAGHTRKMILGVGLASETGIKHFCLSILNLVPVDIIITTVLSIPLSMSTMVKICRSLHHTLLP